MKNNNCLAFLFVCSASPSIAEVAYLDDAALSAFSGQAGLVLDTSTFSPVREFEYNDHALDMLGMFKVSGHGAEGHGSNPFYTDQLDNFQVQLNHTKQGDASADNEFVYGFSKYRQMADIYLENGNEISREEFEALAKGYDAKRAFLTVDDKKRYDSGDLVVHYNYLDPLEKEGGIQAFSKGEGLSGEDFSTISYDQVEDLASRSVDFKYAITEIGLSYGTGTGVSGTSLKAAEGFNPATAATRLMSNFHVQGYLGPHDLHIREYDKNGAALGDNGITWNSYFKVTDLDVYLDIKGVQISDLQIHNNRGDLSGLNLETQDSSQGNSSFGFAHAQREIYAIENAVLDIFNRADSEDDEEDKKKKKNGIAFNTRFKGDMDINHMSFGDTGVSIGEYYITDMYFNSRLTILHR